MWTRKLASTTLVAVVGACQPASRPPDEDQVVAFLAREPAATQQRILARAAITPVPVAPPERTDLVGRGDKPLTLVGRTPEVGDPAPPFSLVGTDMKPVTLESMRGKTIVLSVVPSIDTRVCESQTHHINELAARLPASVAVLTVSRDLPFAQKRFMEEAAATAPMASDYKGGGFGADWGLAVKESGLLARSAWVIGPDGKIAYRELVADQGTEPDFEPLTAAITAIAGPLLEAPATDAGVAVDAGAAPK